MARQRARRAVRSGSEWAGGRNGLRQAQLVDLQRARIVGAMFDVATQRGVANVSVAHVVERSGVSRRTFYEIFDDREDCFLAAFEDALGYASERVLPVFEAENGWRERVRAALIALLGFFDEEPVIARLLIVESHKDGKRTLERREEVLARIAGEIERGREQNRAAFAPPSLTGEGVLGGVLAILHSRLTDHSHGPLVALANPLMSMIVLPYMGSAAARRELERPLPARTIAAAPTKFFADPFKDAGMRLTYRTVRVLIAIAEHPQASNRLIGETAGIDDQGQISKLLGRLKHAGMVTNTGLGPGQGAPNAWTLTPDGQRVVDNIHSHAHGWNPTPAGQGKAERGTQA
jgi:AcrR family transcriptional regulator